MAMNLDTTFKLKAKVEGARNVTQFKKQLRGLETSSKMSKAQLGKMNIEINIAMYEEWGRWTLI